MPVLPVQRQHLVVKDRLRRKPAQQVRVDLGIGDIDPRQVQLAGEDVDPLRLVEQAGVDRPAIDARRWALGTKRLHLLAGQQTVFDKQRFERHGPCPVGVSVIRFRSRP